MGHRFRYTIRSGMLTVALLWLRVSVGLIAAQPPAPERDYTVSVDVDLVVVHATVRDKKGGFVFGLRKEDFRIYEDGQLQEITVFRYEDIPVTVGIVVDNSGSMSSKRSQVVAAALAFARSSNAADEMFVVNFNENVSMGLPEGLPFTNKEADLRAALVAISTVGKTALYDGIATSLEHLKKGTRDKKVLIVISDGGDNASRYSVRDIMTMAEQSNAIIYPIGLFDENDPDKNPRVLKQLAKVTGGEAFLPDTTSKVVSICEQIARDIRNQYTIGYVPTNKERNGAYRRIQVIVTTPDHRKVSVRTRPGYLAPTRGPQASFEEAP